MGAKFLIGALRSSVNALTGSQTTDRVHRISSLGAITAAELRAQSGYPFYKRIPNPESRIPNPESRIPNPESRIPNPEHPQPLNRTIFTHDNLPILRGIDSETIDLIYLDPPFNTGKQWHAPIGSDAEGASFDDIWAWDAIAEAQGDTLVVSVKRQWLNALHVESPVRSVVETAEVTAGEEMGAYLAFMAMRLIEMHRILKPTGSIYLHCDPTASHYLKLLMDAIFGRGNFRREITWNLQTASGFKSQVRGYVRSHDIVHYFSKGKEFVFNHQFREHKPEYVARFKRTDEEGRRYRDDRPGRRRQYLDETKGVMLTDVWSDIMSFQQASTASERTGFPTQKPLALLERIIKASSNPGDVVLDPFCGCATACVAAEKLGRRWIGIDVSELAVMLCDERIRKMQNETGLTNFGIPYHVPIPRDDIPARTDLPEGEEPIQLPRSEVREQLWQEQHGRCNGCEREIPFDFVDLMDLDHIKPRSKGGRHVWSNVQLLCRSCNVKKGNRSMADLRKRLAQEVA